MKKYTYYFGKILQNYQQGLRIQEMFLMILWCLKNCALLCEIMGIVFIIVVKEMAIYEYTLL